ncbi:MAG TPA: hypothetical protein VEA99_00560, partial [Gemmatimonadaceae bacterium]|nr:hypothetical protein [Gemmatimonadaceae bacterium]
MRPRSLVMLACALVAPDVGAQAPVSPPPASQSPSPMVETTRRHERLAPRDLGGTQRAFVGPQGKPVELWIPD